MAVGQRDWQVNGESLVLVKGRIDSAIAALTVFGLSEDPIQVTPKHNHDDLTLDAWGKAPADVQWKLGELMVTMNLIHFDPAVLDIVNSLAMGGANLQDGNSVGQMARAGQRLGNNLPRFGVGLDYNGAAIGNNYIGLNIASPVRNRPWRFFFAYLAGNPYTFPLGAEKSVVRCNFRVIPYQQDPANIVNGVILGASNYPLFDRTLDT